MRSSIVLMSALAAALLQLGCAGTASMRAGDSRIAGAPTLRVGQSWTFRQINGYNGEQIGTIRETIVDAAATDVRVELTRADGEPIGIETYTADWGWRTQVQPGGVQVSYQPAFPAYAFPLAVGKSWTAEVSYVDSITKRTVPVKVRAVVQREEKVRVPAGEFDAFKIRRDSWARDGDGFRTGTTTVAFDWYVAALNHSVRHESRSEYQLTASSSWGPYIVKSDWNVYELASFGQARSPSDPGNRQRER